MEQRFQVVFDGLRESIGTKPAMEPSISFEITDAELDEIRELRRLSALVEEPEPSSYTST